MKNQRFIYYGLIYFFFYAISSSLLLAPIILLLIFLIMFIVAAVALFKHKSVDALILTVSSLFVFMYTLLSWQASGETFYFPDIAHLIIGLILLGYGIFKLVRKQ